MTVRFAETDAQGVAHHASYLVWFEVARVAYLAEHAGGYRSLQEQGLEAVVIEAHLRYGVPARFDDRLRIHARGWTEHACVDAKTFRPMRIPAALKDAIARAESAP